ncbi:MAG: hypothetical protein V3T07_06470 [Myxococcota bacterium]
MDWTTSWARVEIRTATGSVPIAAPLARLHYVLLTGTAFLFPLLADHWSLIGFRY